MVLLGIQIYPLALFFQRTCGSQYQLTEQPHFLSAVQMLKRHPHGLGSVGKKFSSFPSSEGIGGGGQLLMEFSYFLTWMDYVAAPCRARVPNWNHNDSSYYCCLSSESNTVPLFTVLQEPVGQWNDRTLSPYCYSFICMTTVTQCSPWALNY